MPGMWRLLPARCIIEHCWNCLPHVLAPQPYELLEILRREEPIPTAGAAEGYMPQQGSAAVGGPASGGSSPGDETASSGAPAALPEGALRTSRVLAASCTIKVQGSDR